MPLSDSRHAGDRAPSPAASDRATRPAFLPLRRVVAGLTAGGLVLGVGACDLRVGEGAPEVLPTMTQAQAARDALARRALLIASTAQEVAGSAGSTDLAGDAVLTLAGRLAEDAAAQAEALGGMWQPWPSGAPTDLPTTAPLATATPGTDAATLLTTLADGVAQARQDLSCPGLLSQAEALATASVAVAWARDAASLAAALGVDLPEAVAGHARSVAPAGATDAAGTLLASYDQARYAMEEVAARSQGTERERAATDARAATAAVSVLAAAGAGETRLGAYARQGESDAAWAQAVWLAVASAEIRAAGAKESTSPTPATEASSSTTPGQGDGQTSETADGDTLTDAALALDAAIDAVARAVAWGAEPTEALPGLDG